MTTTFTKEVFSSTYKDDYADSASYHRILFNSGRALQARELTQLQTIIQKEIERLGRNIFKEGASVLPGGQTINTRYEFVKIDPTSNALPAGSIVGQEWTETGTGIKVRILEVVEASGSDPRTFYVAYTNTAGGSSGSDPVRLTPGASFNNGLGDTQIVQVTNTTANPATGRACRISVAEGAFFVQGHFVYVKPQSLIVDKFNNKPTKTVGFLVTQDIVTASDTSALYDNQGETPNTTSPGADRYRIQLTLTTKDQITGNQNFIYLCEVVNGVVLEAVSGLDEYNKIEKNIARRTKEINGDFFAKPFRVSYESDSAGSPNTLIAAISPGTAFVNGFRASTTYPRRLRVPKSQSLLSIEDEISSASYGNYVKVTNVKGQPNILTKERQNLNDAITLGGNTIGTCRVRAIEKDGSFQRYYLFDIKMNSGQGFSSVKSIGTTASQHADTTNALGANNGIPVLYEPSPNNLLFDLKHQRPNAITDIDLTVQRRFTGTATGAGELALTAGSGEVFVSTTEWIVTNNSNGNNIAAGYGTSGLQNINVTGLGGGTAVTILAKVKKTSGSIRIKTLNTQTYTGIAYDSATSLAYPGAISIPLQKPDLFEVDSIRADSATGRDISSNFLIDNGQRDNFYGPSRLVLKGDRAAPSSTVYCKFKYFTHNAGDFFGVNSYTGIVDYDRIPSHTLIDGTTVNLRDVLDFRPVTAANDSDFVGGINNELPDHTDTIDIDTQYYKPRLDRVVIDQDGIIKVKQGTPDLEPTYPPLSNNEMILADVRMNAGTLNDSDISLAHHESKGFTMKDIGRMESKIDQLFEISTLNALETGISGLASLDSSGNDRTKAGFLVDNFRDQLSSDTSNIEYRAAIDPLNLELRPQPTEEAIRLIYDSDRSVLTRLKGDNIYAEYYDSVWISQLQASQTENINPFAVITNLGHMELSPASDEWKETQMAAEIVVGGGTINNFSGNQAQLFNSAQWNWAGTDIGATRSQLLGSSSGSSSSTTSSTSTTASASGVWSTVATTTTDTTVTTVTSSTTTATARVDSFSTIREVIDDKVIDVALIPFMRSRRVYFKVQGLKPTTKYYPFFDGVNVAAWCTPTSFVKVATQNNEIGNQYANATQTPFGTPASSIPLQSNSTGVIEAEFLIPNTQTIKFKTGVREFKVLDITADNEENAMSFAKAPFVSSGILETRQETIKSTRVRNIVTGTDVSSSSSSFVSGTSNNTSVTQTNFLTGQVIVDGVTTVPATVVPVDPLAQSFYVPENNGVFVTKVDIYFATKQENTGDDTTVPVQLQLRPLVNGHPSSTDIVPGSVVFKNASAVTTSTDATSATTFEFDEPIYLLPYIEYAVVLLAETTAYTVYVAETEQFVLGSTEKRITSQPSMGSLFKSQNATTWNADQTKDLMFQIHRAKFTVGTVYATLDNASVPMRLLENDPFQSTSGSTRIVCNHKDHGFKTGDQVVIHGLDSASTYAGISATNILNTRTIDSADEDTFTFDAGSAANTSTSFGGNAVSTTQNYMFEQVYPFIDCNLPQSTSIALSGNFQAGRSTASYHMDPTLYAAQGSPVMYDYSGNFVGLAYKAQNFFTQPQVIANDHTNATHGKFAPPPLPGSLNNPPTPFNSKSATIVVSMNVDNDYVSPVLDMQRASLWLTHNRVDNQVSGGNQSNSANNPINYKAETDPTGGTSIAKHITRPITLNTSAVGLRIILSANKPSVADFKLYYKTLSSDQIFSQVDWEYQAPERTMPSDENPNVFRDYEFLVGGKEGLSVPFTKFQLKIVMNSSNNAKPPKFRDLRVIALIT